MILRNTCPALAAVALSATALAIGPEELPPPLHALHEQGTTIAGTFPSKTGLKDSAAMAGEQAAALYVTPGGAAIAGSALDANGQEMDATVLDATVRKPVGAWVLGPATCRRCCLSVGSVPAAQRRTRHTA